MLFPFYMSLGLFLIKIKSNLNYFFLTYPTRAEEEKKKENLSAAKKMLEEYSAKEAAHWSNINLKLNLLSMIGMVYSATYVFTSKKL